MMSSRYTYLDEYIRAAGICGDARSMLFRSAHGRTDTLSFRGTTRIAPYRTIRRRAEALAIKGFSALACRK